MKQLQRLLFLQGNKCFFCNNPIPEGEASVEHLDALSNGGEKVDQNCVVCCKTVNAALGNLTVKEKFRVVLNQHGLFACPSHALEGAIALVPDRSETHALVHELFPEVIDNIRRRGTKRPAKLATLRNAISGSFPQVTADVVDILLKMLTDQGYVLEAGSKVTYARLDPAPKIESVNESQGPVHH